MSTKEKILELVDQLDDAKQLQVLEELKQMFEPKLDSVMKEIMTQSALRAEEDIKAGRVYTIDETRQIINKRLGL
jgi:hypothetical protein